MDNGINDCVSYHWLVPNHVYGAIQIMGIALKVAGNVTRIQGRTVKSVWVDDEPPENPWEKYQLKLLPKRINGKWYKHGSWCIAVGY